MTITGAPPAAAAPVAPAPAPAAGLTPRTRLLPPELVVQLAWGLTGEYSAESGSRLQAQVAKERLTQLRRAAANDPDEQRYVEAALGATDGALRNLAIIIQGRNLNFQEADEIRQKNLENAQAYAQFTGDLSSLAPRLSALTIGGAGGAIALGPLVSGLLGQIGYAQFAPYALPVMAFGGAAIAYLFNGLVVLPRLRASQEAQALKKDYARNLYYDQYVLRSRFALEALYAEIQSAHQAVFGDLFPDGLDAEKAATRTLSGLSSTMCPKVHQHIQDGTITPDLWARCETGADVDKCPFWRR